MCFTHFHAPSTYCLIFAIQMFLLTDDIMPPPPSNPLQLAFRPQHHGHSTAAATSAPSAFIIGHVTSIRIVLFLLRSPIFPEKRQFLCLYWALSFSVSMYLLRCILSFSTEGETDAIPNLHVTINFIVRRIMQF